MLMRKGIQYTLVILCLLSASAAHAVGEGTGVLRDCRFSKVMITHERGSGGETARNLTEGMTGRIIFGVDIVCRLPVEAPRYTLQFVSWAPDGTARTREIGPPGMRAALHYYYGEGMPVQVGQYRFEINARPRQAHPSARQTESKMGAAITLVADPAPCPRKILPPRVIHYGG